jgi:hypothetical protein
MATAKSKLTVPTVVIIQGDWKPLTVVHGGELSNPPGGPVKWWPVKPSTGEDIPLDVTTSPVIAQSWFEARALYRAKFGDNIDAVRKPATSAPGPLSTLGKGSSTTATTNLRWRAAQRR